MKLSCICLIVDNKNIGTVYQRWAKIGRHSVFCIRLRMQILEVHNSNHTWMNSLLLPGMVQLYAPCSMYMTWPRCKSLIYLNAKVYKIFISLSAALCHIIAVLHICYITISAHQYWAGPLSWYVSPRITMNHSKLFQQNSYNLDKFRQIT